MALSELNYESKWRVFSVWINGLRCTWLERPLELLSY
jgi:hypothetical protein